ncbi:MAG: hypothetical protein A2Y24_02785 [Clostridiales bacterium GWE2_32_10]|nr:MAG: hypothetical protein A2Y24_02785 [Clostridiales bacterium GWE2_32_10]HBY19637.1 hypothetical protein [Clostridiales bacterium]
MKYRKLVYTFILFALAGVWGIFNMNTSNIEIVQAPATVKPVENNEINQIKTQENLTTTTKSTIININTATKTELDTLYKIGPKIADKIIEYREKNGKFKSKEDIMNVKGIGEKTFEKIKDSICLGN